MSDYLSHFGPPDDYIKDKEHINALLSVTVISVEPIDEGYAVAVEITDAEYELDDDDEGSAISELRAAGFDAEWRDDYEPQENGRTRVTIFAIPREKCEDCAVRFLAKDGFCADDMVLCRTCSTKYAEEHPDEVQATGRSF